MRIRDASSQRDHQKLPNPDVVDQHTGLVYDVNDIEGLAVLPVLAHVVEDF